MKEQYIYAVARIRALEVSLLSDSNVYQLTSLPTLKECLDFLHEKGWGKGDETDFETVLTEEDRKIWRVVRELGIEHEVLEPLLLPELFHNLKAAIKSTTGNTGRFNIYYEDTDPSPAVIEEAMKQDDPERLSGFMRRAAREALDAFNRTGDGQLSDSIVDRACLDTIYVLGQKSKEKILVDYTETYVGVADVRIAVRAALSGKRRSFLTRALSPCKSVSVEELTQAALTGVHAIQDYLTETPFADGVDRIAESPAAFELWCDNHLIETIKPQKYLSEGIGPIVAYIIARQMEIKTVRIVLAGKQSGLDLADIRERIRHMYV